MLQVDEATAAALEAESAPERAHAPAPAPASSPDALLTFLAAQQERQAAETRAMIERIEKQSAAASERAERFATMMVQTVTTFANSQLESARKQAEIAATLPQKAAGGDPLEKFFEGVEFAKGLMEKNEGEKDDTAATLGMVVEGIKALQGVPPKGPDGTSGSNGAA